MSAIICLLSGFFLGPAYFWRASGQLCEIALHPGDGVLITFNFQALLSLSKMF